MFGSTQARYWFATIACENNGNKWSPTEALLDDQITYIKGQKEIGIAGYEHWQMVIYCKTKIRMTSLKLKLANWSHLEKCLSVAAENYVWKDDSAVVGTRFEFGFKNAKKGEDWTAILQHAKSGNLDAISPTVIIRHYSSLKRIGTDYAKCIERPNIKLNIYWGVTGSGKTYDAYHQAKAMDGGFFRKSSTTKWWDGYKGEENILLDEFDGISIGITHLLQWCDEYPMQVEIKGGSANLCATNFWITSNVDPEEWWNEAKPMHRKAFARRITNVKHYESEYKKEIDIDELYMSLLN